MDLLGVSEDPFFHTRRLVYDRNEEEKLYLDWLEKEKRGNYVKMLRIRQKLPMMDKLKEFREMLHNNQVCRVSSGYI